MVKKTSQLGSSLAELMLASALGLWLMAGLVLCYLSNQRSYLLGQVLAHMQENGRIAVHLISQDVHTAGYIGCLPLSSLTIKQLNNTHFLPGTRIAGWHNNKSTSSYPIPIDITKNAVAGTDILFIQTMMPVNNKIINAANNSILLAEKSDYKTGDILVIVDCNHANIIQVVASSGKSVTITPALAQPYAAVSQLGHLVSIFYYIRKTTRKNNIGEPIYALYRRDINQPTTQTQEVVEGIENLQLIFGVKREQQIKYLPIAALDTNDWPNIVSVQVALLLNSIEPITNRAITFYFNQKEYSSSDHLLRQEWNALIALEETP